MSRDGVGRVEALWRYPVKSMRGEELSQLFLGFGGVEGDRRYAFHSSRARPTFPYFTAREQPAMLLYRPVWRDDSVVVQAPDGKEFQIGDRRLIASLMRDVRADQVISLVHLESAMTDSHPVSLFSLQTVRQLGEELGKELDLRRFRANLYMDLDSGQGFAEDAFVGRRLQLGPSAIVEIIERDERCKMITLDADTAQADPDVMRQVVRAHNGCAGVYGKVVREGFVRRGDQIVLLP